MTHMDPALNPYSPGSGRRPPALVGRQNQLVAFDTVIARTGNRLLNRGIVLSGLRGVGKTVLLNELRANADRHGWFTVAVEANASETGGEILRAKLGRELLTAARRYNKPGVRAKVKSAFGTIGSFTASIGVAGVSIGIEPQSGRADTGQLELDLEEMVEDVATALAADGKGFAIFIDEMQDVDSELLGALLTVQHVAGQREWPFYLIGAGLPNLPAILASARSYAERLFDHHLIGPLDTAAAAAALTEPVEKMGATFADDAVGALVGATNGYPYFLQEFGDAIWNLADEKRFTLADAQAAIERGTDQLDRGFYPSRWGRTTPAERRYLTAMADDGDEGSNTGEIARRLGLRQTSLGPTRAQLIAKGLIYAPDRGQVAYTVPGMADFIHRQHQH